MKQLPCLSDVLTFSNADVDIRCYIGFEITLKAKRDSLERLWCTLHNDVRGVDISHELTSILSWFPMIDVIYSFHYQRREHQ